MTRDNVLCLCRRNAASSSNAKLPTTAASQYSHALDHSRAAMTASEDWHSLVPPTGRG